MNDTEREPRKSQVKVSLNDIEMRAFKNACHQLGKEEPAVVARQLLNAFVRASEAVKRNKDKGWSVKEPFELRIVMEKDVRLSSLGN
jgi:hypothetical protein